jgi:hypothetical protein
VSVFSGEVQLLSRRAKAEVQISLNNTSGETNHSHVITISLEEAQ